MAAGRPRLPSVKAAVARVFGVRPGELGRGVLLFSYLFLVVGSFIAAKNSRDAMFLSRFSAIQLPFVDLPVALLVGLWVWGYIRLGRYLSLRTMLQGSLLVFGGTALAFWYASLHFHEWWVLPLVYIWIGMFGVVAPAQVWTLANYVLTTREAKRLFGFIGSGATLGATVGGLFVQQTVMYLGAESTLVAMAIALFASAVLVELLWRRRHLAQVTDYEESEHATARGGPSGLRASLRLIVSSEYLRAIAAVICLSSCTTALVGWQFKAVTSGVKHESQQMAAFFGAFTFWSGAAALLLQWLVTGRVLRRLGLAVALFVVPVALTLGSFGYLAFGTLAAVVTLRGLDQVLRYSIDRPTVELLYLPLPPEHTFQVKSFIDTVIWRFGDGLAALTIIVFGYALSWTPRQVTWVNLVLLGGWIVAAWVAQRLYVTNLEESIHTHRLNTEHASAPMLDRAATDLLASRLHSGDVQQILYALEQFAASPGAAAHPAVRELLSHANPDVRCRAVVLLDGAGDVTVTPAVERLLYDPELAVRTSALLFVAHHAHIDPLERIEQLGDFEDFSIRSAMVSFLAQPGPTENVEAAGVIFNAMVEDTDVRAREEAARLLLQLPDSFGVGAIERLLQSPDIGVVRLALASTIRLNRRHFIPLILPRLAQSALIDDATAALASLGDRALPSLRDTLDDATVPIAGTARDPCRSATHRDQRGGGRAHHVSARRRHGAPVPRLDRAEQAQRLRLEAAAGSGAGRDGTGRRTRGPPPLVSDARHAQFPHRYARTGGADHPRRDVAGGRTDLPPAQAAVPVVRSTQRVRRAAVRQPIGARQRARVPRERPEAAVAGTARAAPRQRGQRRPARAAGGQGARHIGGDARSSRRAACTQSGPVAASVRRVRDWHAWPC